jgi:hypothetical protein
MAYRVLPIGLIAASVLVAASIGLVLLIRGGAGGPDTALAVLPPIHYKCYQIPPQSIVPTPPLVTLETQFGVEQGVRVLQSQFLCPPAIKTFLPNPPQGNLNDPHLKCYGIQSTLTPTNEDPPQIVTLTDQFGTQTGVAVGPALFLCMPALKAIAPALPSGMLPTVPHYKCYQITDSTPSHVVTLDTQFGTEPNVIVAQAQLLCAPAIKTKEIPGGQPEGSLTASHLKCYQLQNVGPPPGVMVNLLTQFGMENLVPVGPAQMLCQAVAKDVTFPTPTPTPTPSPTPSPTPPPPTPTPSPTPVHYKCYDIVGLPLNVQVRLKTQFSDETNVTVLDPTSLCPPALKSVISPLPGHGPQGDLNATHLKCYNIQSTDNPNKVVRLVDQFGTTNNTVGQARELCAPALKAIVPNQLPVGAQPATVPHYKCYDITGPAPGYMVDLQTQFGIEQNVQVGPAIRLCAPALKTYLNVTTGDTNQPHLKCYQITDPPPVPTISVNLRTQFGDETNIPVGAPEMLCVPVVKSVVCAVTPPWLVPAGDFDCDGFPSVVKVGNRGSEGYAGTLPNTACMVNATPNNEPTPDAWPVDNNDDRKAGLSDILAYIPVFGAIVPPGPARFDINEDGTIGLQDILVFIPFYNLSC